jgi:hypothetical protein
VSISLGVGLLLLSRSASLSAREGFLALGTIAVSLGVGFLVSSLVSYRVASGLNALAPGEPRLRTDA